MFIQLISMHYTFEVCGKKRKELKIQKKKKKIVMGFNDNINL